MTTDQQDALYSPRPTLIYLSVIIERNVCGGNFPRTVHPTRIWRNVPAGDMEKILLQCVILVSLSKFIVSYSQHYLTFNAFRRSLHARVLGALKQVVKVNIKKISMFPADILYERYRVQVIKR